MLALKCLNIPVYFLLVIIFGFKLLTWLRELESFMHDYSFNSDVDNVVHHWHWIYRLTIVTLITVNTWFIVFLEIFFVRWSYESSIYGDDCEVCSSTHKHLSEQGIWVFETRMYLKRVIYGFLLPMVYLLALLSQDSFSCRKMLKMVLE